ncbi:MAG: hypothetical protein CMJ81_07405 [Planctomycetaceae bacterium]|nr:hypothetical protein [Planctomycetaceae bacterium]MBP62134.1 hypothetical protein [Planctomycetaceae bacterium]
MMSKKFRHPCVGPATSYRFCSHFSTQTLKKNTELSDTLVAADQNERAWKSRSRPFFFPTSE